MRAWNRGLLVGWFWFLAWMTVGYAAPVCTQAAGSLPRPESPEGAADASIPIEHIVILMQENHSFDQYFGKLNEQGYGAEVDGIDSNMFSLNREDQRVYPYHETSPCLSDPNHSWNGMHQAWNEGRNDGFATVSGRGAMSYLDSSNLPFYYEIANRFAIADRYFSPVLGPTDPNRFYMMAGTSFGHTVNRIPHNFHEYDQKTIFDVMNEKGLTWKYYFTDTPELALFLPTFMRNLQHVALRSQYFADLRSHRLPQVVFIDNSAIMGDEHPPMDYHVGARAAAQIIKALIKSKYWEKSALFLTYDEAGGYFDHVAPPEACAPDDIDPEKFDRYGFRVPFVAISPYAKRHYVSHVTYDHTSILKFIETKFNLPALTRRDANADSMMDLFDFSAPDFERPNIPLPPVKVKDFFACLAKVVGVGKADSLNASRLRRYY